jgi:hypothetical protein
VDSIERERVLDAIRRAQASRRRIRRLKKIMKAAKRRLHGEMIEVWSAQNDEFYRSTFNHKEG